MAMNPYPRLRERAASQWAAALVLLTLFWLTLWFTASSALAGEGELAALRDTVRNAQPQPPQSKSKSDDDHHHHHHDAYCDDDDDLESQLTAGLGLLIGYGITSPFWGPKVVLHDDWEVAGYFPAHPYQGQNPGYLMRESWIPEQPYFWSSRASVEYAETFEEVGSVNAKFLLETSSRWGVDSEISYRTEKLTGGFRDNLTTGDLNLVYRFAQSPHAQFRTGLGANWLADEIDNDWGFNFTYGFDLFPAKPWVVSAELDWGRLGDAPLIHLRSTVGMLIRGGEAYIGVDHYDVGPVETTTLISGVRVWF